MKFTPKIWTLAVVLMMGVNVLLLERIVSLQRFNLFSLKEFTLTKRVLEGYLLGSDQFLLSRSSVAQGQLHLNRWHGYHGIQSKNFSPELIKVKFEIDHDGEFDLFWIGKEGIKEGIRFRLENSLYWQSNSEGEWVKTHPLPLTLAAGKGTEISLDFRNGKLTFNQKGYSTAEINAQSSPVKWGLQGNFHPVRIDDIETNNWRQDFEAPFNTWLIFFLLPFCFLPYYFKKLSYPVYGLLIFFISVWFLDRFHYSHFQLDTVNIDPGQKPGLVWFEKQRDSIFNSEPPVRMLELIAEEYPVKRFARGPFHCADFVCKRIPKSQFTEKPGPRLLFIGSSQTVGAGADKLENTFVSITHKILSSSIQGLETINVSQSGTKPQQMLDVLKENLTGWDPDYVVINFGFNGNEEEYYGPMKEMLKASAGRKIFIINEAFNWNPEKANRIEAFNQVLAGESGATIIPLHEYMAGLTKKNAAFLWWDYVHFNNIAHFQAGNFVAEKISSQLKIRSLEKAHYTDVKL